jgi:hypothetical protein
MPAMKQRIRREHPEQTEVARYEDVEGRLRTGDLFVFHGVSAPARIIERVTRSKYSHVGMVVRPNASEPPRIWQSIPKGIAKALRADGAHGARVDDLRDAMAVLTGPQFTNTAFLLSLQIRRGPEVEERARQSVATWEGARFPSSLDFMIDWILGLLGIATGGTTVDCSELVALTWQRIGLLPRKPPANAYTPQDFGIRHRSLRLTPEATLVPPVKILFTPAP